MDAHITAGECILQIRKLHKKYGPITALKDVDLDICRGEIHGLIGENGSGKSTISSIAAGMQEATSGHMLYKGKPWKPTSMIDAQRRGVSMILQEANTIAGCTVAENLFAGQEKRFSRCGLVDSARMNREADALLDKFGIGHIRGKESINRYGFEERKLVELARAVTDETEILVVDETTTALSFDGRKILYRLIHRLAENNKAVIFISHDLDEVIEHCTRLTVLRDGELRGSMAREEIRAPDSMSRMRSMMVGRDIGDMFAHDGPKSAPQGEAVLELLDICGKSVQHVSLALHRGEILGVGGLSGCGMHEIGRFAFGLDRPDSGRVVCGGRPIDSPKQAVTCGIGYISKNRDQEALILEGDIDTNIAMPSLPDLVRGVFVLPGWEKKLSREQIDLLDIKCTGGEQWINTLSGGNKQKVSFAKWLAKDSGIFIMDCPTRGVDIGVKQAMYQLILDMKRAGKAVLMISEEMPELLGMADRLIIMKDFKIAKEYACTDGLTEADVIEHMI